MRTVALLLALSISVASNANPTIAEKDSARIVRAASRLVVAKPEAWTFMIVTEVPSTRFVQFYADDKRIAFDFPLFAVVKAGIRGTVQDVDCSSSPPARREGEVERRYRPVEEEARLRAFLAATGLPWTTRYCLNETQDGRRVGYNASLTGHLASPEAVPPFIELVFKDVYQLPAVRAIEIETDE